MNTLLKNIAAAFRLLGFNPKTFIYFFRGFPFYFRDRSRLRRQMKDFHDFKFGTAMPIMGERFEASGIVKGHYFHQDLLVARRVFANNPGRHIDIGSRTDGFVAHVASFRKIEVYDIRELPNKITNIEFKRADLMNLPPELIGACESISALHVIEHFGLGRYDDPIDVRGHIKAIDNIYQMLSAGGIFYFSTPIGPQRINFNAHRVFSIAYLLRLFENRFHVVHFSYVDDEGDLHENVELTKDRIEQSCGCHYGCGIFELKKVASPQTS